MSDLNLTNEKNEILKSEYKKLLGNLSLIASAVFLIVFLFYLLSFAIKNVESSGNILNRQSDQQINTTIDLINLAIVGGGFIFAIFTVFVSIRMKEWEEQQEKTKMMYNEAKKGMQKIGSLSKSLDSLKKELHLAHKSYITFNRGVSKYYQKNYVSAMQEFEETLKTLENETNSSNENNLIAEVFFYLGNIQLNLINFNEDMVSNKYENIRLIKKAKYFFDKAQLIHFNNCDKKSQSNLLAYLAICHAYLTNPDLDKEKVEENLKHAEQCINDSNEIAKSNNYKDFALTHYNIACANSVLFRYKREEKYKNEVIEIFSEFKRNNIIQKDYILNDPDFSILTYYPIDKEVTKEIKSIIGPFLSKNNSYWEVAKLTVDIFVNTGEKNIGDRAIELIIECLKTSTISIEQLKESDTIKDAIDNLSKIGNEEMEKNQFKQKWLNAIIFLKNLTNLTQLQAIDDLNELTLITNAHSIRS